MHKVRAWEMLCDPEHYSHMTMEDVYRLSLAAGYSEDEAQKAASQRGWERLTSGAMQ
jgi:hypothetical protein